MRIIQKSPEIYRNVALDWWTKVRPTDTRMERQGEQQVGPQDNCAVGRGLCDVRV